MRVLIVEDEVKLSSSLAKIFRVEKFTVDQAYEGNEAWKLLLVEEYDLIVLDINLPGINGITLCRKLRDEGIVTPVLMLTAKDRIEDKIEGLDAGADDYLVKPFSVDELLARVRALLRRQASEKKAEIVVGSLQFNPTKRLFVRAGKVLSLSAKEYAVLEYLIRNNDRVVTKEQLLEHVWGGDFDPFSKVVDVYIGYVRQKVDRDFSKEPKLLKTRRGVGYQLGES
jgi:two-component system, OmpR family, copper resistance phosphate regulon response regulator CusR